MRLRNKIESDPARPLYIRTERGAGYQFEVPVQIPYQTHGVPMSPRLCARETACARFWTLSLMKMFLTCDLTVSGAMERSRAISLSARPSAIRQLSGTSRPIGAYLERDADLEFAVKLAAILRPACGVLVLLACTAGSVNAAETSTPVMLVATDRLAGSGYADTVLFAAPLRNGAHIGFIMNRSTRLQLSDLFPEHVSSRRVKEAGYFGGPVLAEMLFAVARGVPEGR